MAVIHSNGGNASAVTHAARNNMAIGHDERKAYELAINAFAATAPEIGSTIARVTRLVQASDDATVTQYDRAIHSYVETGNADAINGLAHTVATDSIALAVKEGKLSEADAAAGIGLSAALGFDPTDALASVAAPMLEAPAPLAPPSAPAPPGTFTFHNAQPVAPAAPPAPAPPQRQMVNNSQAGLAGLSPTGVRAPMSATAQRAWTGTPTGNLPQGTPAHPSGASRPAQPVTAPQAPSQAAYRSPTGGWTMGKSGVDLARHVGTPLGFNPEGAA